MWALSKLALKNSVDFPYRIWSNRMGILQHLAKLSSDSRNPTLVFFFLLKILGLACSRVLYVPWYEVKGPSFYSQEWRQNDSERDVCHRFEQHCTNKWSVINTPNNLRMWKCKQMKQLRGPFSSNTEDVKKRELEKVNKVINTGQSHQCKNLRGKTFRGWTAQGNGQNETDLKLLQGLDSSPRQSILLLKIQCRMPT